VIPIPYAVSDYAKAFPGANRGSAEAAPGDAHLVEADNIRAGRSISPEAGAASLAACRRVLGSLLMQLEPGCVLTWDSTSPLAAITSALCLQLGIPVQTLERGLLPETLMLESRGIQAASDLRAHWLTQEMPAEVPGLFERVQAYYCRMRPQKYQQPPGLANAAKLRAELELAGRQVVVFFGQFDPSGLAPSNSPQRHYNSPAFASTQDALMSLAAETRYHPEVVLVFKPHPMDGASYAEARSKGVRIIGRADVHALIEVADVVAAQFTTLQFEAALYGKPVLLLGRSAWWGRGATYEVPRREELQGMLRASLRREDWPLRERRTRQFISWIMNDFLIRCSPQTPARRSFSDLAQFLAGLALAPERQAPWQQRVNRCAKGLLQLVQQSGSQVIPTTIAGSKLL